MAKIDTTTLNPAEVDGALQAAAVAGIPLFLWGPPGVGKSKIASGVATRMNRAFVDIRLSQMDPTDVRGMPFKKEQDGVTIGVDWSPPLMFPKNIDEIAFRTIEAIETPIDFSSLNPQGSNGIYYVKEPHIEVRAMDRNLKAEIVEQSPTRFTVRLVDQDGNLAAGRVRYSITGEAEAIIGYEEMNSAPPSVLAACYQLILDRRIGNYVMPDAVAQFAMGNRETDKGVTFKMPTPLLNRFDHLEIRPDFDCWQAWAIGARVHSDVVGFLTAFPQSMFNFNPGTASRGFATPRSWEMVSKLLKTLDAGEIVVSDTQLSAMINGMIGDGVGTEFFEFRRFAKALPNPTDVLKGNVTKLTGIKETEKTGLSYALTTSLLYVLREQDERLNAAGEDESSRKPGREEWYSWVDNYIQFSIDNFKAEVNVMGIRTALQGHGLPINGQRAKKWTKFVAEYKHVLIDS